MKKLLALIFFILIIFTSCKKADTEKDDTSEATTIEPIAVIEPVADVEPELVVAIEPEPQMGVITDTLVRLRSEPNLESETLGHLNTGDKLTILEKTIEPQQVDTMIDYWYKVQLEGYPEGWIYGFFVDYEIVWVEPWIENEVREMLDKPDGVIMKSDLDDTTGFTATRGNIKKIDDIAHFKNLTTLWVFTTGVSDISPLSGLTNLTELVLSNDIISDLRPLRNLTNLTKLRLGDNEITDISPLSGLSNLTDLDLSNNQISDISPLSGLSNLSALSLMNNPISNEAVLPKLRILDLDSTIDESPSSSEFVDTGVEKTNPVIDPTRTSNNISLPIEYSSAYVTMDIQFYEEKKFGNVIEIPHITGGGVAGDVINTKIDEIAKEYQDILKLNNGFGCKVLAYPSTTERYINLLIIGKSFPSYGTDGNLYTFVYDKQLEEELLLLTAMNNDGLTQSDFQEALDSWLKKEKKAPTNRKPVVAGFRMRADATTEYYLINSSIVAGDRRYHFVVYHDGVVKIGMDQEYLIPVEELDSMVPPLLYEQTQ